MPRPIQTDIFAILDLALLTIDERGPVGCSIRASLFALCHRTISDDEVRACVDFKIAQRIAETGKTAAQLDQQWEANHAHLSPNERHAARADAERIDALEVEYWMSRLTEVVTRMRDEQ